MTSPAHPARNEHPIRAATRAVLLALGGILALAGCSLPGAGADSTVHDAANRLHDGLRVERVTLDDDGRYLVVGVTTTGRDSLLTDMELMLDRRVELIGRDADDLGAESVWGRGHEDRRHRIELVIDGAEAGAAFRLHLDQSTAAALFRLEGEHLVALRDQDEPTTGSGQDGARLETMQHVDLTTVEDPTGTGDASPTVEDDRSDEQAAADSDLVSPGPSAAGPSSPGPATSTTEQQQTIEAITSPTSPAPPTSDHSTPSPTVATTVTPTSTTTSPATSTPATGPPVITSVASAVEIVRNGINPADGDHAGGISTWTGTYVGPPIDVLAAMRYLTQNAFPVNHRYSVDGNGVISGGQHRDRAHADIEFVDDGRQTWTLTVRDPGWNVVVTGGPVPEPFAPTPAEIAAAREIIRANLQVTSQHTTDDRTTLEGFWRAETPPAMITMATVLAGSVAGIEWDDPMGLELVAHDGVETLVTIKFVSDEDLTVIVDDPAFLDLFTD